MKTKSHCFASGLVGAVLICVGLTNLSPGKGAAEAEETKKAAPQVVLAETYNAVTKIYFTNIAVHKGSHKPGLVERRFRTDLKYWLMDAKYYEGGELSIGNPPLVELGGSWAARICQKPNRRPCLRWPTGSLGECLSVTPSSKRSKFTWSISPRDWRPKTSRKTTMW